MFLFGKKSRKNPDEPLVLNPIADMATKKTSGADGASTSVPSREQAATDPAMRKRRRPQSANKTRLVGFDTSDGRVLEMFCDDKADTETRRMQFPVGLIMVIKGPGFGETFALKAGMSQIGRGEGQAVQLNFGDMAISRENHAAIVYDPQEHGFLLGHGGKSNIVRLNGRPVVTTTDLKDGDEIEIGETKMRFLAICSAAFNWENAEAEGGSDDDDMEIA